MTEDKRYVYQEFMSKISTPSKATKVYWDIRSPADVGIKEALADLQQHGLGGGTIHVERLSPSLKDHKPAEKEISRTIYALLLENALAKYRVLPTTTESNNIIDNRRQLMGQLSKEIYTLRREENQSSIAKFLTEHLGIPDVVAPEHDSTIPGGERYNKLDIAATLAANTESDGQFKQALKERFNDRDAFIKYIDGGLREDGGFGPLPESVAKANRNHWDILQIWRKAYGHSLMTPDTAKQCSSSRG
ncbi:hypothetical protein IF1G_00669 [Cordyceps javanica]|uniref:Uncharacterized protein n=1 Tax=Cordyceps javanica TaxID=43265 RepID=A0A545WD51_9HYPO|nr:hypothetical protein IF1G_00669 [Cordyceps javanica]TQW11917.1 hypothetical protein IF2G_00648 [Cordyceps javanica]